jgi:hypothetical protein
MADYGFEVYRPDGSLQLSTRETVLRLVHIERIAGSFSGTFSVPDFDADEAGGVFTGQGFFYVQYGIQNNGNNAILNGPGDLPILGVTILPSLNWNNATKTMTVTPAAIPSGWWSATRPDYDIIFCHFR